MSEYSSAPWKYCGDDRGGCQCGQIWSANDDHVATAHWAQHQYGHYSGQGELAPFPEAMLKANARLIAAAPELLEALKELTKGMWAGEGVSHPLVEGSEVLKARLAIAKAEGRS